MTFRDWAVEVELWLSLAVNVFVVITGILVAVKRPSTWEAARRVLATVFAFVISLATAACASFVAVALFPEPQPPWFLFLLIAVFLGTLVGVFVWLLSWNAKRDRWPT
jgi:hypothetical protein